MADLDECAQPLLEQRNSITPTRLNTIQRIRNSVWQKMPRKGRFWGPRTDAVKLQTLSQHGTRRKDSIVPQPTWKSLFGFTTTKNLAALACAGALSITSGLVSPALAIFLGGVFDKFSDFGAGKVDGHELQRQVTIYSLYLTSLGFFSWFLNGCFFMSWLLFGELQAKVAQRYAFDGLASKPIEWYDMRKSGVSALIIRLQTQIRELQLATSQPLGYILQYLITSVASLAIAFYYSWALTLVIIATLPISAVVLSYISNRMQPHIQGQQQELANASKSVTTAFSNIITVKCFNGQTSEAMKYTQAITSAATQYLKQAKINATQIGFARLITFGMFIQGFWYGHHLVATGQKTTGNVVACFWSCLTATQAVEQVLPHMLILEKGRTAGASLRSIATSLLKQRSDNEHGLRPGPCRGQIAFQNVSFAYPARPDHYVLKHFSGTFAAGEITFLVGQSGSGKSTIGQLLARFYEKNHGCILFDGHPLEKLDVSWLRRNILLVEQASVLFMGSIKENIAFGRPDQDVSLENLKTAIRFALLEQTVDDMPDRLDTLVNAEQSSLSGGQKQRVALARARLKDSPVLILDEATSALDQTSRSLIMRAIRKWREGKTTIIITHDLTQIQASDIVYMLRHGRIVHAGHGDTLGDMKATGNPSGSVSPLTRVESSQIDDVVASSPPQGLLGTAPSSLLQKSTPRPVQDDFWTEADSAPIELGSFKAQAYSRMSLIPTAFAGTATGLTSSNTQPMTSFLDSQRLMNSTTNVRRPTLRAREHSQNLSSSMDRRALAKENPKRRTQFGMELLELAGMRAVEARLSDVQSRRTRRASSRRLSQGNSSKRRELQTTLEGQLTLEEQMKPSMRRILKTVWATQNKDQRFLLTFGLIAATIHAALTPVFSFVFSKLLATFFDAKNGTRDATIYSLSIIAIAVFDALACFLMHYCLEYCGQIWVDTFRQRALTRVLDQPLEWFGREQNSAAQLSQILDRNTEEMRNLLGRFAAFMLVATVMMFMALIWSMAVSYKLTLVGLSIGPVSLAITRSFQAISVKMESLCNEAFDKSNKILSEVFTNVKTVRALSLESIFKARHAKSITDVLRTGLKRALLCGIFFGLSEALLIFTDALIFWYGAILVSSKQYTVQSMLTVFSMLLFSFSNISAIVAYIPQIQSSKDNAHRLLQLSNLNQASHEHMGNSDVPKRAEIRCRNLSFAYPMKPDDRILHKINLTFSRGRATAIVGPSGCGKSTLTSLLLRLYPIDPASMPPPLTLNGVAINAIRVASLRNLVAVVPQTPVLFPTSIRENICYGLSPSSALTSSQNIQAAAASAGVAEFIDSLPNGYDTVIGDGGTGVSGGQAQRINIARALVRQPKILLLDEATSALDPKSARLVRDTVKDLVKKNYDMTVIIITHTPEMMEIADRIVMLEQGSIVEVGKLEEMLAHGGKFASMMRGVDGKTKWGPRYGKHASSWG